MQRGRAPSSRARSRLCKRQDKREWTLQTRWTRDRSREIYEFYIDYYFADVYASGFRFFDGEDLVCGNVCESLHGTTGPGDADLFNRGVGPQAKVNAGIAGAGVPYRRCRLVPLRVAVRSDNPDLRAQTHAVAASSDEANQNPMLPCCADIAEQLDGLVEARNNRIDTAADEDIAVC